MSDPAKTSNATAHAARVTDLKEFRELVGRYAEKGHDADLRSKINLLSPRVRQYVIEAGCFQTFRAFPPPIAGGYVVEIDAFTSLFNPPYPRLDLPGALIDMVERAIGAVSVAEGRGQSRVDVASSRKRGPAPVQLERVKAEMRAVDWKDLESWTQEAMKAQLKASRETCCKARREVLSEIRE
jgi:hypothetical protein